MGKWNRAPQGVSEEFLQNEERRKQMIIEAAKRRKEKQRKMQQQQQEAKRNEEAALIRHKQEKKDAYVKYLRNNMHDKYEEMKRREKVNQPSIRSGSKWKKESIETASGLHSHQKDVRNLDGLNLQVNLSPKMSQVKRGSIQGSSKQSNEPIYKKIQQQLEKQEESKKQIKGQQTKKRRLLKNQFEEMWGEEQNNAIQTESSVVDDLLSGSQLLDSLDLDGESMYRSKCIDKELKSHHKNLKEQIWEKQEPEVRKDVDQIKNMIGYESVLVSIDERSQMLKKYNELMKNEVGEDGQQNAKNLNSNQIHTRDVNQKGKRKGNQKADKQEEKLKNEGEVFNELKNKKQAKILNWANEESEEADDLFSNCSTRKTKRVQQLINQKPKTNSSFPANKNRPEEVAKGVDMKRKERPLESIPERRFNTSKERLKERSYEKKNSTQTNTASRPSLNSGVAFGSRNTTAPWNKPPVPSNSNQLSRDSSRDRPNPRRNTSQQKKKITVEHVNNTVDGFRRSSKQSSQRVPSNSFQEKPKTSNIASRTPGNHRSYSREKQNNYRSGSKEKQQPKNEQRSGRADSFATRPTPGRTFSSEKVIPTHYQQQKSKRPVKNGNSNGYSGSSLQDLPPVPSNSYRQNISQNDDITVATQDQMFQVESFIKNQLVSLNREERLMQQELKELHMENKDRIKAVEEKYQIKTDYRHSKDIKGLDGRDLQEEIELQEDLQSNQTQNSYGQIHKKQTEDELEDSIQRLDDMLMRRDLNHKNIDGHSRITEQDNESSSTSRSLINPMCDPITLHKQVLQLADNLSRFQKEEDQIEGGYGQKVRMMKKKERVHEENQTAIASEASCGRSKKAPSMVKGAMQEQQLAESQEVNFSELNAQQQPSNSGFPVDDSVDDGFEDSIQMHYQQMQQQEGDKISVNERLKKMLLESGDD